MLVSAVQDRVEANGRERGRSDRQKSELPSALRPGDWQEHAVRSAERGRDYGEHRGRSASGATAERRFLSALG
jgi:hypothetical protein